MADNDPEIYRFPTNPSSEQDPVVISGIGIGASVGSTRESVWKAIQSGRSGIRRTYAGDHVGSLRLPCGMVDWLPEEHHKIKSVQLSEVAAEEAIEDAGIDWSTVARERFACSISTQFGDIDYLYMDPSVRNQVPFPEGERKWWDQFLPSSASRIIAEKFGLHGPRLCHATACASGLVSTIAAARMIEEGQADYALCGAADAVHELILASFYRMGVLADDEEPSGACRPFDVNRKGFVMGEGAAMMILERRSQALARGATVYAELAASATLCQAHHVTGLDGAAETLTYLIQRIVSKAGWDYRGPQYINAHGTGTEQNDRSELKAIRSGLGDLADQVLVSSNKACLGHLINAAGSIELALTAMALRDGFAPPTMHLEHPEKEGHLDCLAEYGVQAELDRALKLSLAFGGHLVGIALRRCPLKELQRNPQPLAPSARIRQTDRQVVRRAA